MIIRSIQDDSENGHRELYSGVQYRAFTGDLISRDMNLESFWAALWSYWATYQKAYNKIIKICLVGTSEQLEVSLRRRGYYPGNRRTSPC